MELSANNKEFNSSNVYMDKFIEATLKFDFIIKEILKLGLISDDHLDWIKQMIDSIYIPETSLNTKNKFIPTINDNDINEDGDEEEQRELIKYLSENAELFSKLIGESINYNLSNNYNFTIKSIIKIQSNFRRYLGNKKFKLINKKTLQKKIEAVLVIQKYIRNLK